MKRPKKWPEVAVYPVYVMLRSSCAFRHFLEDLKILGLKKRIDFSFWIFLFAHLFTEKNSLGRHFEPAEDFPSLMQAATVNVNLVVRLYRGLYLDRYAGKRVKLLLEVAGCMLSSGSKTLLTFPATVSGEGVVHFDAVDPQQKDPLEKQLIWVERSTGCLRMPKEAD